MSRDIHIPAEARAALARGDRIGAIKHVREANHGVDLRAAMEAIDAHEHGGKGHVTQAALSSMSESPPQLPSAAVVAAVSSGQLIEAIKLVREQQGLGLKEAKELVDRYRSMPVLMRVDALGDKANDIASQHGVKIPAAAIDALAHGNVTAAINAVRNEYRIGLKDAEQLVDAHRDGSFNKPGSQNQGSINRTSSTVSRDPVRHGMVWALASVAILAAIALWWVLGR